MHERGWLPSNENDHAWLLNGTQVWSLLVYNLAPSPIASLCPKRSSKAYNLLKTNESIQQSGTILTRAFLESVHAAKTFTPK